jgi:alkylation response protein AidB-like acyl-CoA dehydrogenase
VTSITPDTITPDNGPIRGFFLGNVAYETVLGLKAHPKEERESLELIIDSLRKFMETQSANFREFDEKGYQSEAYIAALKDLGLFGLIIPEEFDGMGLSSRGYARVLQEISRFDGSTGLTVGAHSSIGMKALLLFGNNEQKKKYLPELASGMQIAAFCLTEAQAGSDAASLRTKAVKQPQGGWILNGEKIWITNGPLAQFYTVFARTGEDSAKGISAFIVERNWAGVQPGAKEDKMGIRASATSTVAFQDVFVPPEALLGEEGQGFKIAVAVLNNGRSGLGGGCVGAMKRCIALATAHAQERKQFGQPIGSFGLIREKIVRMNALCFASESMVQMVGQCIDENLPDYSVEAAASKVFATEALWTTSFEALQIAGGNGFMKEYPYELITRDSRINLIFEGTNEILRLFVGLKCLEELGIYLKKIQESVGNLVSAPKENIIPLKEYVAKKISYFTPNETVSSLTALVGINSLPQTIPEYLKTEAYELASLVTTLHHHAEGLLRKYKKDVKQQQLPVAHLADAGIQIYAGYCTLARALHLEESDAVGKDLAKVAIGLISETTKGHLQAASKSENNSQTDELGKSLLKQGGYKWDVALDR